MCLLSAPVYFLGEQKLNIGRCGKHHHLSFYNAEVGPVARAGNGVFITLSIEAQQKIAAAYDGTPLLVETAVDCCSCGGCCCGPKLSCCSDCTPLTADAAVVQHIWYGKVDAPYHLPGICTLCCPLVQCINFSCLAHKIKINSEWVQAVPSITSPFPVPSQGFPQHGAPVAYSAAPAYPPSYGADYGSVVAAQPTAHTPLIPGNKGTY